MAQLSCTTYDQRDKGVKGDQELQERTKLVIDEFIPQVRLPADTAR